MTHREFLIWLKPRLDNAGAAGLGGDGVRAVREELEKMRKAAPLQPFASRLLALVSERSTLDGATVADLVTDLRYELAPPRERTMVLSASPEDDEK
jgi:hypothetical protein